MPVPLPDRIRLVSELRDQLGRPLTVPAWTIENIWKPLDGFKAWPAGDNVCPLCAARAGGIRSKRRLCYVAPHGECDGLVGVKIAVVVIDVPRQEGKTTGAAGYAITDLALGRNIPAIYFAAAEDVSDRVFDQKLIAPIKAHPRLSKELTDEMHEIKNLERANSLRYIPTSAKQAVAGTYRRLYADEIRDVEPEIILRALPTTIAAKGMECPFGHYSGGAVGPGIDDRCPVCKIELEEFAGAALLMSSAGDDDDLHSELVDALKEIPDAAFHLFSSTQRLNPNKSLEAVDALDRVFSRMPRTRALAARELHNVRGKAGDLLLSNEEIKAVTNRKLRNVDRDERPAIAFLDCSRSRDLTSLVVAVDAGGSFGKLIAARIDVFDPASSPTKRVIYRKTAEHPGASIEEHLAALVPGFIGLLELWIDVSVTVEEAKDLATWAKKQPWGMKVREYTGEALTKKLMWDHLEMRILAGPKAIEIPDHEQLKKELRALGVKEGANGRKVYDSTKGDRRGGSHRDLSFSLAGCCWAAAKFMARASDPNRVAILERLQRAFEANTNFKMPTAGLPKQW